jgi:TldD protein
MMLDKIDPIKILEGFSLSGRDADFVDVRIEETIQTRITTKDHEIDFSTEERLSGAFIRVKRAGRWNYLALDNLNQLEDAVDRLAPRISGSTSNEAPQLCSRFKFKEKNSSLIQSSEKRDLLLKLDASFKGRQFIVQSNGFYKDVYKTVAMKSSDGRFVAFDRNLAGVGFGWTMKNDDRIHNELKEVVETDPRGLENREGEFTKEYERALEFFLNSTPVEPGDYPVVLSPITAGVFAHESFGHKSEADFMIGDEVAKREWAIGTRVGSDLLSIVDAGGDFASGYTPFDDEGSPAQKTYLIRNGTLAGRLHSKETAADMDEAPTGNGRALNFLFEPIVRMTNTYIEPGKQSFDELIKPIAKGIYVHDLFHGSGLSTFTIAPRKCWMIENGKLTRPVRASVLTGSVFETLGLIDGVSSEFQLISGIRGGCGKFEQWPLSVSVGGPFVRVSKMRVS